MTTVCGCAGAVTGIVIVATSFAFMAPSAQVTVVVPEHEPDVVVAAPAGVTLPGRVSVTVTLGSLSGPWFSTVST